MTSMPVTVLILLSVLQVCSGQTWVQQPRNVSVTVGSNVYIPCGVQDALQHTVIWTKGSVPIFVNGQKGHGVPDRFTIETNNTLVIQNVELSDTSFYTCNMFGFGSAEMYLKVTGGSLTCLSCSSVDNSTACKHSISCENDEVCYVHQYTTESGREYFDFGCSNPESCATYKSRRTAERSYERHNLCSSCCNNTDLCNKHSRCEGNDKVSNRSCLSCTDVSPNSVCSNITICKQSEVCFAHHYITESGDDKYDFGCSNVQSCPSASLPFVGKRADGRHSRCIACCNETDTCNRQTKCNANFEGITRPRDCSDVGFIKTSGIYTVFPYQNKSYPVTVYCEVGSQGALWTVIQRRFDGSLNFTRNWNSYNLGFGNADGEYWIGNDVIHALTRNGRHELRVEMTNENGTNRYAQYGYFVVDGETENYRLHVANYTGNAGDSLSYHDGHEFSTIDRDNDMTTTNCAEYNEAGWWFNKCYESDLNGIYTNSTTGHRIFWLRFPGIIRTTTMMIRKVS